MAIKKYRCRINWLNGCEFFDVCIRANSERKARMVCGCEEIRED